MTTADEIRLAIQCYVTHVMARNGFKWQNTHISIKQTAPGAIERHTGKTK